MYVTSQDGDTHYPPLPPLPPKGIPPIPKIIDPLYLRIVEFPTIHSNSKHPCTFE